MRSLLFFICILATFSCSRAESNLRANKNVEKLLDNEESSLWGRLLQDGGSMSVVIGDEDDDIGTREAVDGKKGKKGKKGTQGEVKGAKKGKKGDGKKTKGKKETEAMI